MMCCTKHHHRPGQASACALCGGDACQSVLLLQQQCSYGLIIIIIGEETVGSPQHAWCCLLHNFLLALVLSFALLQGRLRVQWLGHKAQDHHQVFRKITTPHSRTGRLNWARNLFLQAIWKLLLEDTTWWDQERSNDSHIACQRRKQHPDLDLDALNLTIAIIS
jgi:hypothetical protein